MKVLKTLCTLFVASLISFSVSAQASSTQAAKPAPASASATKNTDKVNAQMHGPKKETVYTDAKGVNYYWDSNKNKVVMPAAAAPKK